MALEKYDSEADTRKHIARVSELLSQAAMELLRRGVVHDQSKLGPEEKPLFDKLTPKLTSITYGSPEYYAALGELKPALDHHYANNSHHPQYYKRGINGMDLFDVIEMFFDWKAASERHDDGDIYRSIDENEDRFSMTHQLAEIFRNTAKEMGW